MSLRLLRKILPFANKATKSVPRNVIKKKPNRFEVPGDTGFKGYLKRNFSPESLAITHGAAFKDPIGGLSAFLDLPNKRTINYYKSMEKGPLKNWSRQMVADIEARGIKNKPLVDALKKDFASKNIFGMAKRLAQLGINNPLSVLFGGMSLSMLPEMVIDPIKQYRSGEIGSGEAAALLGSNALNTTMTGPLTQMMFGWPIRESIARSIGKTFDNRSSGNPLQFQRPHLGQGGRMSSLTGPAVNMMGNVPINYQGYDWSQ